MNVPPAPIPMQFMIPILRPPPSSCQYPVKVKIPKQVLEHNCVAASGYHRRHERSEAAVSGLVCD